MKTAKHQFNRRNTRSNILSISAILLVWAFSMSAPVLGEEGRKNNAPAAEISENQFDFGKVAEGSIINHDFSIRNTGPDVLEIQKVNTG
jgi:hypothetical protein